MNEKYFYITVEESFGGGRIILTPNLEQISEDEENRHYREFLAWVAQGNEPGEWTAP